MGGNFVMGEPSEEEEEEGGGRRLGLRVRERGGKRDTRTAADERRRNRMLVQ